MRITNIRVSDHVSFFTRGICERWGLSSNYIRDLPTLFFGCYSKKDIEIIQRHQSLRIVMLTGAGSDISGLEGLPNLYFINVKNDFLNFGGTDKFRLKEIRIPVKDYRTFSPLRLGDKIYIYLGNGSQNAVEKHGGKYLPFLNKFFGEKRIITGILGNSIEYMRNEIYPQAAINLQLNPFAGFTTSTELAYMGRHSVSNFITPWSLSFQSEMDIARHCMTYLDRAGEYVQSLVPHDFYHESDDWLHSWYYSENKP